MPAAKAPVRTKSKSAAARRPAASASAAPADPKLARIAVEILDEVESLNEDRGEARLPTYFRRTPIGGRVTRAKPELKLALFIEGVRRLGALRKSMKKDVEEAQLMLHLLRKFRFSRLTLLGELVRKLPPLSQKDWETILTELAPYDVLSAHDFGFLESLATRLKRDAAKTGLTPTMADAVQRMIKAVEEHPTSHYSRKRVKTALRQASFHRA
jgi:hypothetical protein